MVVNEKFGPSLETFEAGLELSAHEQNSSKSTFSRFGDLICWSPPWCRPRQHEKPKLSIGLTILYATSAGFSAASLYYSHPILHILAEDFGVSQADVANIPTLAQAGEATCLLLIMPLADFFPRRKFTLVTTFLAASFWLGLCLTSDLGVFLVLTYLSALFTCVVHIVIPLVSALSTPEERAFHLSIVGTGPTLGILTARILSGVVTNYTSWRNVYWIGLGIQIVIFIALFMFMPDYETLNPIDMAGLVKGYPRILWSIVKLYFNHPTLVQACILAFCSFAVLTSYWTTLTFLLSEAPYEYSTSVIGLFGLIGAATLLIGPLFGKWVIQPLKVRLYSAIIGQTLALVAVVIGTFVGVHHVAGPVIEAVLLDAGLIIVFVANRMSIDGIDAQAVNRVNTAFMCIMHLGQLAGTKAGNDVYDTMGGWLAAGYLGIGITIFSYLIIAVRGPHETGWIGWRGGWGKSVK